MVVFPNAKINLGLRVTAKRSDGYHNIDTVFYPLPFYDVLEGIHTEKKFEFTSTGKLIKGDPSTNLCVKAYQILRTDFPQIPEIKLHLHKNIPMGAGLGGGSSDGAFTLKLLNEKFNLNISDPVLEKYALSLGSDCPFFIKNKACSASGRGEEFEKIELDLQDKSFLLINPGFHISTAEAFSKISIADTIEPCAKIVQQPIQTWKENLFNDFEKSAFSIYPILEKIKQDLYDAGALYASITGTGSSMYGIFDGDPPLYHGAGENTEVIKIFEGKATRQAN